MSDIQFSRSTVIRGKLESAYGVETPPGANDAAFEVSNLSYKRLDGSRPARESVDPYFGHPGELPGRHYSSLGFSTYVRKVGTPGDKPDIDPLLQACGLAAVITGGQDVTYNPVQKALKSMTFWAHLNGHLHKVVGARGSLQLSGELGGQLRAQFSFQGLPKGSPADEAFPTIARPDGCVDALDGDNCSVTLFGTPLQIVSFSIDLQNQLQHIVTSAGEQIAITNRAATGELVVIKPSVSEFDYHAKEADPCATGTLELTAGGLQISAPAVSLGTVTDLGDHNGVATVTLPLMFRRSAGNDDLLLKFS